MASALADSGVLLSMIVFLPMAAAFVLLVFPRNQSETVKQFVSFTTVLVFLLTIWIAVPAHGNLGFGFSLDKSEMQFTTLSGAVATLNVYYSLGLDGVSMPLVVLTTLICMLAMRVRVPLDKDVRAYCMAFLITETGMLGVLMSLDLVLFLVFWEVMLLAACFLIGVWGGPRRKIAALKFFFASLAGSLLMVLAISMIYRSSDLNVLDLRANVATGLQPVHTFSIPALTAMGQLPQSPFDHAAVGRTAFVLLLIAMALQMAAVPLHGWLRDAVAETPAPVAMVVASVLMRMGGYGLFRLCYPMFPAAASDLAWLVCGIGLLTMIYGAGAALLQKDFARLAACSMVSQTGFVFLGLGAWSASGDPSAAQMWKMGVNGAMYQLIASGITSAAMIYLIGIIQDRAGHRDLDRFGGLLHRMPIYGGLSMVIFLAALGSPGLCGFVGELLVLLSTWSYNRPIAIVAMVAAIAMAAIILRTIRRVFLGRAEIGSQSLAPMRRREIAVVAPLVFATILLGVYPRFLLSYTRPTLDALVDELTDSRKALPSAEALEPLPAPRDPVKGNAENAGPKKVSINSADRVSPRP